MDKKATTLIERFGFKDTDLTTPEHDEMFLWLLNKQNSFRMLKDLNILKENPIIRLHRPPLTDWDYDKRLDGSKCDWSWTVRQCSGNCGKSEIEKEKMKTLIVANFAVYCQAQNPLDNIEIYPEYAILGHNNYNIGFIDIMIKISPGFTPEGQQLDYCHFESIPFDIQGYTYFAVEIKTKIESIGELFRQISLYKSHLTNKNVGAWIVFTKTPNLKDVFLSQNIYVYEFNSLLETTK